MEDKMKKNYAKMIFLFLICLFQVSFSLPIYASSDEKTETELSPEDNEELKLHEQRLSNILKRDKIYPDAKKPRTISEEEIQKSAEKIEENAGEDYVEKTKDIFKFGLEEEISKAVDEITENEDLRFTSQIYQLFQDTKSPAIREKILDYFAKLKDPCLEDYACEVINDPYDVKKSTVSSCFKYVSSVGCKAALPGLVDLVDKEDEAYFDGALSALGELGEEDEAVFLADYLDRDDLSLSQRQSLMKVLGRLKALETWDKIVEIAENEDENSFVRMYAAEAIGAMEKSEGEDILIELFESDDPNLRIYVLKGLSHFKDEKADAVILQSLRDSQFKVRQEAVTISQERKMKDAVPYMIYRCKDSSEQKSVKEKCYDAIAELNTEEGNSYLVSLIKDKKTGDSTKIKVASCLLKYGNAGTEEIIELARDSLKNDVKKNLRYALGKEFVKYARAEFQDICAEYLASEDQATQGTGLDIFQSGKYLSLRADVEKIAADDEENARKINEEKEASLGIKKNEKDEKNKKSSSPAIYYKRKTANPNAPKAKRILSYIDSLQKTKNEEVDAVSSPDVRILEDRKASELEK